MWRSWGAVRRRVALLQDAAMRERSGTSGGEGCACLATGRPQAARRGHRALSSMTGRALVDFFDVSCDAGLHLVAQVKVTIEIQVATDKGVVGAVEAVLFLVHDAVAIGVEMQVIAALPAAGLAFAGKFAPGQLSDQHPRGGTEAGAGKSDQREAAAGGSGERLHGLDRRGAARTGGRQPPEGAIGRGRGREADWIA